MSKKLQDTCIKYSEKVQGTEELWKCKCGKELKQRKGTGLYGKEWSNVVALIADNCELNKAISDQTNKPLIGCASHRFALAVNKFISGEMETVTKVNSLMVKLRTLKMSAKLREHTPLRPVLFNTTRWTSISFMIKRYLEIKSVLIDHFSSDPHLLDLLLSPREEAAVEKLNEDMKILNSVTVALQRKS